MYTCQQANIFDIFKLYAHNYQHASMQIIYKFTWIYKYDFHMAQPHVIFMHCLYLAKLNPVLRIGRVAQLEEHWTDDLEIAGSSPLYATIFLPAMFACWHTSLQVESKTEVSRDARNSKVWKQDTHN